MNMKRRTTDQLACLTLACLILSSTTGIVTESDAAKVYRLHGHHKHHHSHHQPEQRQNTAGENSTKLFVFGDSYADTGNWPKPTSISWKKPYGITFPGEPSGRFSDGRVLTDYIAMFLGISSPVAYARWKMSGEKSDIQNGINFAYGGTGVFTTLVNEPNMTTQINTFQQLVEDDEVYGPQDLVSSVALVSLAGNDYATFMARSGNSQDSTAFTKSFMSQVVLDLERIHGLGVQKVYITALEPLGCLPVMTAAVSHANCSELENSVAKFHNQLLQQSVDQLNNQTGGSVFAILDLYTSFMSALNIHNNRPGNSTFPFQLSPCCVGTGDNHSCGSVNNLGVTKYSVCEDPGLSFFWDSIHPSQQGWEAVYLALGPSLLNSINSN